MRLWTVHFKYLDTIGLVSLWREALLVKSVLSGNTKGYKYHPQLERFKKTNNPIANINNYLISIYEEASSRGYSFDYSKIDINVDGKELMKTSLGQLKFEFKHLQKKLLVRNKEKYQQNDTVTTVLENDNFLIDRENYNIECWEKYVK